MTAEALPIAPIEGLSAAREIQRDEDVLSLEAQHALEAVGSALGVLCAVALVASQLGRARRLLTKVASSSPSGEAHRG